MERLSWNWRNPDDAILRAVRDLNDAGEEALPSAVAAKAGLGYAEVEKRLAEMWTEGKVTYGGRPRGYVA